MTTIKHQIWTLDRGLPGFRPCYAWNERLIGENSRLKAQPEEHATR